MLFPIMPPFPHKILISIFALLLCLLYPAKAQDASSSAPPSTPGTVRVFFIGNSVTDQINYDGLTELAKSRGITQVWGRHMIPGAPLSWLWDHQDGFTVAPYGASQAALANFTWDIVSFQPFDRRFKGDQSDKDVILRYLNLAKDRDADTQFYIYERWPRMESLDGNGFAYDKNNFGANQVIQPVSLAQVMPYEVAWNKTLTDGWDLTNESRDYFEKLTLVVRQATPQLKKPFLIVPVGEVMYQLDRLMIAGKVPGYTSIYQFYADVVHLRPIGQYVVGCTYFATLYKQDPTGLPVDPYSKGQNPISPADAALAPLIQATVWKVVSAYPYAGIAR
jgi:hypothetical protein